MDRLNARYAAEIREKESEFLPVSPGLRRPGEESVSFATTHLFVAGTFAGVFRRAIRPGWKVQPSNRERVLSIEPPRQILGSFCHKSATRYGFEFRVRGIRILLRIQAERGVLCICGGASGGNGSKARGGNYNGRIAEVPSIGEIGEAKDGYMRVQTIVTGITRRK